MDKYYMINQPREKYYMANQPTEEYYMANQPTEKYYVANLPKETFPVTLTGPHCLRKATPLSDLLAWFRDEKMHTSACAN
jgi:hypothetical protein